MEENGLKAVLIIIECVVVLVGVGRGLGVYKVDQRLKPDTGACSQDERREGEHKTESTAPTHGCRAGLATGQGILESIIRWVT